MEQVKLTQADLLVNKADKVDLLDLEEKVNEMGTGGGESVDLTEINNAISTLQTQLASKASNTDVTALQNSLSELSGKLTTFQETLSKAAEKSALDALQNTVTALAERVTALETPTT